MTVSPTGSPDLGTAAPAAEPAGRADVRARVGWNATLLESIDFRRARTSTFVRAMKLMLPLGALAILGLVLVWPQLRNRTDGFRLSFANVAPSDGGITMQKARYHGTDRNNRPYLVTADVATQEGGALKQVTLDRVTGDITMGDNSWMSLIANTGLLNQNAQTLWLQGDISIFSDRGYEFHGLTADIDLKAGTLATDDRVWGHGPLGQINANAMRVYDRGDRVVFTNGVKTVLYPKAQVPK